MLYRPRETRSISALTIRSTKPGRLSSSQDFSIGRSISLTRSSSVRALLLSTVLASVLNADSTAETVERERICCAGELFINGGGSNAGCRCGGLAATVSANSTSSSGSNFWNEGCGGSGVATAISSVRSNTSGSGRGCRTSSGLVASSSPFSSASMSSWLLLTAGGDGGGGGAGGGATAAGAGLTGGGAGFAAAAGAARLAEG